MKEVFSGSWKEWERELLLRKSKWLLYVVFLKVIFFMLLLWALWYLVSLMSSVSQQSDLKDWIGIIILFFMLHFFIGSIVWFVRYFYDVVVCSSDKLIRVKLWLINKDTIDSIELYRIQEMEVMMDWFFRIIFNVWDIGFVELNDQRKIIHWIDKPKRVMLLIQEIKDKLIKEKWVMNFKVDK